MPDETPFNLNLNLNLKELTFEYLDWLEDMINEASSSEPITQNWLGNDDEPEANIQTGLQSLDDAGGLPKGAVSLMLGPIGPVSDHPIICQIFRHAIHGPEDRQVQWITCQNGRRAFFQIASSHFNPRQIEASIKIGSAIKASPMKRLILLGEQISNSNLRITIPENRNWTSNPESILNPDADLILISQDALPITAEPTLLVQLAKAASKNRSAILGCLPAVAGNRPESLLPSGALEHCFQVLEFLSTDPDQLPIPKSYFFERNSYAGKLSILFHRSFPPVSIPVSYDAYYLYLYQVPDLSEIHEEFGTNPESDAGPVLEQIEE